MAGRIVFTGKQQVKFESFDSGSVGDGMIKIKTLSTLMSTGTENIVLNRLFDPGTGWDNWVKYPFYPGYAAIGVVEEVGKGVTTFKKGDRIASRKGHASEHVLSAEEAFPVPDGIPDDDATWFALAKIAAMGAKTAEHRLGQNLVIVGAGPIGQMSVRWAASTGAGKIICIDPVEFRLKLALKGGADSIISKSISETADEISKLTDGKMADTVIDTTGHHAVLPECFKLARKYGKIVILGDTGSPEKQHLTHDVMSKGLTIVAAHDCHETEDWNSRKIIGLFFKLVLAGKINLGNLKTHEFKGSDCVKAYALANEKRSETMGIIFKW